MAFVINDRVKETSTTTGTGTLDLGGAQQGFETFVAGIGTVTDASTDTLSRTSVISSSNGDSLVNFTGGTKDVFCTLPASKAVFLDNSGEVQNAASKGFATAMAIAL